MIITKTVSVNLCSANISYFEKLGYIIPKSLSKYNKLTVPKGTKIIVQVRHLPKHSHILIDCQCDKCGKIRTLKYGQYYEFCLQCACQMDTHKINISKSNKGKKISEETKINMRKNNGLRGKFGSNHPSWNINKSDEERIQGRHIPGIYKWKKLVKERDNYTCQCCSSKQHLQIHHLNNYLDFKEQRILLENGITLCENCHKLFHKVYGKKHTDKKMFNDFINNYLA